MEEDEKIFKQVLDAAFAVHSEMEPGLLENVYEKCLLVELRSRGLKAESQVPVPVVYKGEKIDQAYRADLIVEDRIIVEIKAVAELTNQHWAQILNYLKLKKLPLGLLVNFSAASLKDGIRRVVNSAKK
ncbi:MAG: GxxExxY protein [Candidatus Spyradosoma sp.]